MTHISERESQLPDLVIGRLLKLAVEDDSIISLGPGEPDFDTPEPIKKELKKIINSDKEYGHYSPPGGRKELKEAIIGRQKKDYGIDVNENEIIATCGSQESILLATAATMDPSEEIIIPNPSFLAYLPTIQLFNGNPKFLELKEEDGWDIDPDELEKLITKKTVGLLINTPSNPTGTVLDKKLLEEILDICVDNDIYLFSDEAYEHITYDDTKHVSPRSLNGSEDHVVSFHTFSKSFAMCGYRLGYTIGPEKLIKEMTKSHIYSTLSAPTLSQMVGAKALKMNKKHIDDMTKQYDKRRKMLVKRLNKMNLNTIEPKGAFYTFSNVKHLTDNSLEFAEELLKEAKVAVVPGTEFGRYGEGYIRCSYATDYELIEDAMDRIEDYLTSKGLL